ncbi:MAG: hypothetical protein KDA16_13155 [Phycisphaerales bacterium]|nr:hypothetical protein [Phycisphaerales bacterium]
MTTETKTTPTDAHLELMRHAVGWPKMYRNYFATCPGDSDCCEWDKLVDAGLAIRGRGPSEVLQYQYFHVSEEGISALRRAEGKGEEVTT